MTLPELWEPIGTTVTRTFTDEELKEIAARIEGLEADSFKLYTVHVESLKGYRPGRDDKYQVNMDVGEDLFMGGGGETEEAARWGLVQGLIDSLRYGLQAHLELAGPRPKGLRMGALVRHRVFGPPRASARFEVRDGDGATWGVCSADSGAAAVGLVASLIGLHHGGGFEHLRAACGLRLSATPTTGASLVQDIDYLHAQRLTLRAARLKLPDGPERLLANVRASVLFTLNHLLGKHWCTTYVYGSKTRRGAS